MARTEGITKRAAVDGCHVGACRETLGPSIGGSGTGRGRFGMPVVAVGGRPAVGTGIGECKG